MTKSRSIGGTRRKHHVWLQRAAFGSQRWRADCRCGWVGTPRRYEAVAWGDGATHVSGLNRKVPGVGVRF